MCAPNITFMKNIYLSVVASVLIMFTANNIVAQNYTLTDADVTVANGEITACSYDVSGKVITIPSQLNGQTIVKTGYELFNGKGMTGVILPSTLQIIGQGTFANNSITSVTIPDNVVEIGGYAFKGNNISSVTFNSKLTTIKWMAFQNNNLGSVSIPNTVTYIGSQAFLDNPLESIILPTPVQNSEGIPFSHWENMGSVNITYSGGESLPKAQFDPNYRAVFEHPQYTVSGTVSGAGGVTISYQINSDNSKTQVVQDDGGNYSFTVNHGSNVTITATKEGYTFAESYSLNNITADVTDKNFTATKKTYTVTGTIRGADNVLVKMFGHAKDQMIVNDGGSYSFTVEHGLIVNISASKPGYEFNGPHMLGTVTSNISGKDLQAIIKTYTISGTVSGTNGVLVSMSGDAADKETINDGGSYSFAVNHGSNVTITATKEGYEFGNPIVFNNIESNKAGVNFAATLKTYTVTGTVSGADGVLVKMFGQAEDQMIVNDGESYSFTVEHGLSVAISASKPGYDFNGPHSLATVKSNISGKDLQAIIKTYTISGTVNGTNGVLVSMSGGATNQSTVNDGSSYSFTVNHGSNVTITATKEGYEFGNPIVFNNIESNKAGVNFAATLKTYTISGTVSGADGVLVSMSGGATSQSTVNDGGNYSFTVNHGSNVTITATKEGYEFGNPVVFSNIESNKTDVNFEAVLKTYTISGTVTGASDVEIIMSGDKSGTQSVGHMQSYSFVVEHGNSVTISAEKEGYTFIDPVLLDDITEDKTDINFVAEAIYYDVSGTVTGAGGVTISYLINSDNTKTQVVQDDGGNYNFQVLYNSNVTITATKEGYTFAESYNLSNIKADVTGKNFTATINIHTISGVVSGDKIDGVTIELKNIEEVIGTTSTDATGNYSLEVNYGSTGMLIASSDGYTFDGPIDINNLSEDISDCNFTSTISKYTISGVVSGDIKEGVTIQFKTGETVVKEVVTDASGGYSMDVDYGTTGVLTANLEGYTFGEPLPINNIVADKPDCNFTSIIKTYIIKGTVNGASNVTVLITDANRIYEIATVNDGEEYEFSVDHGTSVNVSASKRGYTFNEAYIQTNVTENVSGLDFTATINSYTISGKVTGVDEVEVKLSGDIEDKVTVNSGETYSFTVTYGVNVTVSAIKEGYVFAPVKYIISEVGDNITDKDFIGKEAIALPEVSGSLNFGDVVVGSSQTNKFVINNIGNIDLIIDNIEMPEGFSVSKSGLTIVPGESTDINVTFRPSEIKDYSGLIKLTGNFAAPFVPVPVVANGVEAIYTVVISITDGEEAIENALVRFNDKEYRSNNVGDAIIEGVKSGSYNYTVEAEGYSTYTGTVVVSNKKEVKEIVLTKNSGGDGTSYIDSSEEDLITIAQNPVGDILQIELKSEIRVNSIIIYDIKGEQNYNRQISESNNIKIDVSGLDRGVYFIKIKSDTKVVTVKKFVKN